jgi:hypothetical protein
MIDFRSPAIRTFTVGVAADRGQACGGFQLLPRQLDAPAQITPTKAA